MCKEWIANNDYSVRQKEILQLRCGKVVGIENKSTEVITVSWSHSSCTW